MRQPSVIKVETRAIRRIDLRMFAACELSLNSLSNMLNIDTPVRSMSIGCESRGNSRNIHSMNARWIEQSLVRQRTDSSRGELDVKNGGAAAFILTSRGGAHDPPYPGQFPAAGS